MNCAKCTKPIVEHDIDDIKEHVSKILPSKCSKCGSKNISLPETNHATVKITCNKCKEAETFYWFDKLI